MLQVRKEKSPLQNLHLESVAVLGLIVAAHYGVRRTI
jgi:hypothetical protein